MFVRFHLEKQSPPFELSLVGEFHEGITGIFGPSGSGKTTLLKCLAGFLKPDSGEVLLNDRMCFSSSSGIDVPVEERRIGMVWQDTLLFPHMTVEQNILYGRPENCRASFAGKVIDIFAIRPLLSRYPETLSGGEKQRVAIARALLTEPQMLLFDEPVVSLDDRARYGILSYLKEINREMKIPILYVSHSVSELVHVCHDVYMIRNGKKRGFDEPERIFFNEQQLEGSKETFENVYDLKVNAYRPDERIVELEFGGFIFKVPYSGARQPTTMKIGLLARDILVATDPLRGISARNIIPAAIESVQRTGDLVMMCCRVKDQRVWAEITPRSFKDLNLHVSQIVYLVIKTRSLRTLNDW